MTKVKWLSGNAYKNAKINYPQRTESATNRLVEELAVRVHVADERGGALAAEGVLQ